MLEFFDAHTHTNLPGLKEESEEVIRRALVSGVGLVNSGTEIEDSRLAVRMAHEHENEPVYASVGLHPEYAAREEYRIENRELWDDLKKMASDPKTVAIGECGLDYYRIDGTRIENREYGTEEVKKRQKEIFEKQIELAREAEKPLVIHCRDAFGDLIEILNTKYKILSNPPGVIHFFTGTKEEAERLLDMGFSFTFGGAITYPPKPGMPDYESLVGCVPLDRILSETDAPFVAPVPYRGKRNEPAYVVEVVKKLAEIKSVSVAEMAAQTLRNARKLFGIS